MSIEASTDAGRPPRRHRALRPEWLGQMAASLLWIASVVADGPDSAGDWLQLTAASAWAIANVAALRSERNDP